MLWWPWLLVLVCTLCKLRPNMAQLARVSKQLRRKFQRSFFGHIKIGYMVEAAGIEPASVSSLPLALHA